MKKRIVSLVLVLVLAACVLAGCAATSNGNGKTDKTDKTKKENTVDLKGEYTVKDPAGLEYDARCVLYKPHIKGDELFEKGARNSYTVLYSLKSKGKHMFAVEVFDTKEHATAYKDSQGKGTVDGTVVIVESDEAFFTKMESFVPTINDWINNLKKSGYMELK